MAMPSPCRQMNRVPRFPVIAYAIDFGPAGAFDNKQHGIPGMAVDSGNRTGVDFMHQCIHGARRRIPVPADIDAAAHTASGVVHDHVFISYYGLTILTPLLNKLCAPLLLQM